MSEMSYDDARDALANLGDDLVLKARDLMLTMNEPAEGARLERELDQFSLDEARSMLGQLDDSQLRDARDLVSAMEEQVRAEGCIDGRTDLGGGVHQWKNRSGRRKHRCKNRPGSMGIRLLEEGCINRRTGMGGGVHQWKNRSGRRGASMEEQVREEGCIDARTGLGAGVSGCVKWENVASDN